jgi:hypothetical protein
LRALNGNVFVIDTPNKAHLDVTTVIHARTSALPKKIAVALVGDEKRTSASLRRIATSSVTGKYLPLTTTALFTALREVF